LFDKLPLLFSQKLSPCVLYENKDDKSKNVVGVAPFSHQTFAEFEPIDSLSQAYEKALFLHNKPVSDPKLKATTAAQKKFQNIVSAQNASIATLSAEVVKNQKVATYLYENHTTFEVSASLKSLGVTTYNPAKKTVIVDIPELVE
jgi:hypothetical protein